MRGAGAVDVFGGGGGGGCVLMGLRVQGRVEWWPGGVVLVEDVGDAGLGKG